MRAENNIFHQKQKSKHFSADLFLMCLNFTWFSNRLSTDFEVAVLAILRRFDYRGQMLEKFP